MLEFQDGFFEQEIREGFYIDRTMKAVWAAEMEVLQRVAEICDRYDIAWYAAYGTLLGAIRHEGYVPWDDDLDIWVKREGYNKLVQLLPRELPEGYSVKSPLTAEGYTQFHMMVQNSSYFHLESEWLEQYHGCPFSAGVDIFPLDNVPRDENERTVQKEMASIAARGGQLAYFIVEGLYEDIENQEEEKGAYIEEIMEGIQYLQSNLGVTIDRQLVAEERWKELASEFMKWANYIAMMYGEEESDDLAYFVDYVAWPEKRYPREWFTDPYSAKFENFMLPIPREYDQVLRIIYGDYNKIVKGKGMHNYPYYIGQQDEMQQKLTAYYAKIAGGEMETEIYPVHWESMLHQTDGTRKKIVLYANDINDFIEYGEAALDKLESVLQIFHEAGERILLWWRPQEEMVNALTLVDLGLAGRYSDILRQYKTAGWGVCDESNDRLQAINMCDAYYGAKNNLVKPLCDQGKPVMIGQFILS